MQHKYGILTTAWGKPRFLDMAVALGRSLRLRHPRMPAAIVTDSNDPVLYDLFDHVVAHRPEYGVNFAQKLHLDLYSPFDKTLYLDSDCLVIKPVDKLFEQFADCSFCIPSEVRCTADSAPWDMDNAKVLAHFGLESIPKFNAGLMYFTNSPAAHAVFTTARTIFEEYEEIGFWHLPSGSPNDEPIYAVAMSLNGIEPMDDGGRSMRTPFGIRGPLQINVLRGICHFNKNGHMVSPAVMHFPAGWQKDYRYCRECHRLKLHVAESALSRLQARWVPAVTTLPAAARNRVGRLLRSIGLHPHVQAQTTRQPTALRVPPTIPPSTKVTQDDGRS